MYIIVQLIFLFNFFLKGHYKLLFLKISIYKSLKENVYTWVHFHLKSQIYKIASVC